MCQLSATTGPREIALTLSIVGYWGKAGIPRKGYLGGAVVWASRVSAAMQHAGHTVPLELTGWHVPKE